MTYSLNYLTNNPMDYNEDQANMQAESEARADELEYHLESTTEPKED